MLDSAKMLSAVKIFLSFIRSILDFKIFFNSIGFLMRVLHVINSIEIGGAENFLLRLMKAKSEKNYNLYLLIINPIQNDKKYYEFWKKKVTQALNSELEKDELFVNLASNEYFSAVDVKALKVPVITPEFKDYKDGKLKMISFFAKKARGLMVRFIIDTNAETIEDLKKFNYEGYAFDANLSKGNTLVFTR